MKLYDCAAAPNPRRVRFFAAEKGIDLEREEVDLFGGENLAPEFRARNPLGLVPALELDDGTVLFEAPAICRYLESRFPEPNLMGHDPVETAVIEAWERFAEINGMLAVGEYFRNVTPELDDRAVSGMTGFARLPALVARGEKRIAAFYSMLEARLATSPYLAGSRFTLADITAVCAVDFAAFTSHPCPAEHAATRRWHEICAAREGAAA